MHKIYSPFVVHRRHIAVCENNVLVCWTSAKSFLIKANLFLFSLALESLGFGSYIAEVKDVLQECKTVALKRRKASSRLENLGIPEEELLRQQQELFAKARIYYLCMLTDCEVKH